MRKVHCHGQEYWTVCGLKCSCGTPFTRQSVGVQLLSGGGSGHVDVLHVECESCHRITEIEFDISTFFGKPDLKAFREVLRDKDRIWEMYVSYELRMESVLKYLSELAANHDADAIEFVLAAGREFLDKARGSSPGVSN